MNKLRFAAANLLLLIFVAATFSQQKINKKQMAAQVKTEFPHAWNGHKKYDWRHDDLKLLSKSCKDRYGETLLLLL